MLLQGTGWLAGSNSGPGVGNWAREEEVLEVVVSSAGVAVFMYNKVQ